jgi:serine protease Do
MANFTSNRRARRAIQAGAVVLAVGAGYALRDVRLEAQNGGTSTPPAQKSPVIQTPATRDAAATQNAFVEVSVAVQPAVVKIQTAADRTTPTSNAPRGGRPQLPGPEGAPPFGDFQEFFKRFQREFGTDPEKIQPNSWQGRVLKEKAMEEFKLIQSRRGGGLGSGVIYRQDGLILTNAHVVRGADTVTVELSDGRRFEKSKVLGRDERTDIAVVKINATGLPTAKLGDSDEVRVGDWAIAVGNPFGLDHTLTIGVISAKSRELNLATGGDTRTDYLQTDASINPGNSGGPLLDIYGRVIGINNAIYSESGGNQGIGFAIPVNTARFVADRITAEGKVRRGYLGVQIGTIEDQGAAFGLDPNLKGVLISGISDKNGPGAKAGLVPGDVVTKFNGTPVSRSSELQRLVGNSVVGSTITLDVIRDGKTIKLSAILQELPDSGAKATTPAETPDKEPAAGPTSGTASVIPGLRTANLTAALAKQLDVKVTKGVVVTNVEANSAADDAGLQRGDVIEQVAQTPITTVTEFESRVKAVLAPQTGATKKVAVYINRGGERNFAFITID